MTKKIFFLWPDDDDNIYVVVVEAWLQFYFWKQETIQQKHFNLNSLSHETELMTSSQSDVGNLCKRDREPHWLNSIGL